MNIFDCDIPDWVASEGWYTVCECGQLEQWTLRQTTKRLLNMEKNPVTTGPVKHPMIKAPTVSPKPRATNYDHLNTVDLPLSTGPLHDVDQVLLTTTESEITHVVTHMTIHGINSMNPDQIRQTLSQLQFMARTNVRLKMRKEFTSDYHTWMAEIGPKYKSMRDKRAVWKCQKAILAQIKQSRIDKVLEAKIDINLAPLDHLLCL